MELLEKSNSGEFACITTMWQIGAYLSRSAQNCIERSHFDG